MDAFTLLELDHRQVEQLLDLLAESSEGDERDQVLVQLQEALAVHMQFEETEVYPLVPQAMDRDAAEEADIEHRLARDGLAKLTELAHAPGFGAAVEMLKGGITHHVEEEEGEMFPALRPQLDAAQRSELATRLAEAKRAAGLPVVDLDGATKEELLDLARMVGIGGRSRMTKDELMDALAGQGS